MIGASTPTAPSTVTTDVGKVEKLATNIWNVTEWPETDLAADLGWSAGWLVMMLGMMKVVSIGLHAEFSRPKR